MYSSVSVSKAAKPIDYVFTRETPTDPDDWGVPRANPVPKWQIDWEESDRTLSNLGNAAIPGAVLTGKLSPESAAKSAPAAHH